MLIASVFSSLVFLPLIDTMRENSSEGNKKRILKLNVISKVWRSITLTFTQKIIMIIKYVEYHIWYH